MMMMKKVCVYVSDDKSTWQLNVLHELNETIIIKDNYRDENKANTKINNRNQKLKRAKDGDDDILKKKKQTTSQ